MNFGIDRYMRWETGHRFGFGLDLEGWDGMECRCIGMDGL